MPVEPNRGDVGRDRSAPGPLWRDATPSVGHFHRPEATLNACGVGVAMLQGHSWAGYWERPVTDVCAIVFNNFGN
jgi:hypothetical protein